MWKTALKFVKVEEVIENGFLLPSEMAAMTSNPLSPAAKSARQKIRTALAHDDELFRTFQENMRQSTVRTHQGVTQLLPQAYEITGKAIMEQQKKARQGASTCEAPKRPSRGTALLGMRRRGSSMIPESGHGDATVPFTVGGGRRRQGSTASLPEDTISAVKNVLPQCDKNWGFCSSANPSVALQSLSRAAKEVVSYFGDEEDESATQLEEAVSLKWKRASISDSMDSSYEDMDLKTVVKKETARLARKRSSTSSSVSAMASSTAGIIHATSYHDVYRRLKSSTEMTYATNGGFPHSLSAILTSSTDAIFQDDCNSSGNKNVMVKTPATEVPLLVRFPSNDHDEPGDSSRHLRCNDDDDDDDGDKEALLEDFPFSRGMLKNIRQSSSRALAA